MGDREVSEELAMAMVGKESIEALERSVFSPWVRSWSIGKEPLCAGHG
jgi:hypothetical protein